ncbi:MAG: hypothetical protein ACRDWG_00080 [Actinomycetes bacterium]
MTRLMRRFGRRLRVYCLACDKTAPTGPPELVLAWLDRHRCLGGHTARCGLPTAQDDWCPDCKTSAGITTVPGQLAGDPTQSARASGAA